jgi:hypothetical protein
MSATVYITAEKPASNGWVLITPMAPNANWRGTLFPPLIVNGGFPALAEALRDKAKNYGIPSDASADLRAFYTEFLNKPSWGVAWAMYSELKHLKVKGHPSFGLQRLFANIPDRGALRLVYWWS